MKPIMQRKSARRTFRASASIAALAAAAVAAGPAMGQQAAPQTGQPIMDVVTVTAQFREQSVQDAPLAITAVSGAMMEARSQTTIYEVANQAPSVTLKPQGAAFGPSLGASIRGIGQFDFNPAYEPGVGVYVDDIYYPTLTGSILDLLDLNRVEILRGPQGTLAGKNSIGGAVKLYTRAPQGDNSGFVEATYGSRNRLDFRASADIALAENLFGRISGVTKQQDGYVDRLDYGCLNPGSGIPPVSTQPQNCLLAREGEVSYSAVRGQLRWLPTSRLEVNLSADYTHDDRITAPTVLTFADNPNPNVSAYPGVTYDSRFVPPHGSYYNYASYFSEADLFDMGGGVVIPLDASRADGRTNYQGWGLSGHIDYELADRLSLVSITGYREYSTRFSNDDDVSPLGMTLGSNLLDFWAFSQEVRLNGAFGPRDDFEYTIGGFYLDQKSNYATSQDLRYAPIPLVFVGDDPVEADTRAVFAHVTWRAADRLNVNAGIRYTEESKSYEFSRRNRDGTINPFLGAIDGFVGEYQGDNVDYRLAVDYRWSDAFMTYAQFATGFKGGGVNPRPFIPEQVQPFGQEKVESYEIGFKSDLVGGMLRLNASAFYSDYSDIQLTLLSCPQFGGPGPCAMPQNAGDAVIKGFEVETLIRPTDRLSIDASLSYLDFEYQSINAQAGGPTNPGGVQLHHVAPYTPEWKWSAGIQYEIPLGEWGSLTPRVDAAYQDMVFSNAANTPQSQIESYTLVNARLTWRTRDDDWEVALEATNLFDEYYFLTTFDLVGAGAGIGAAQPGRPQEFAVTLRKRF